MFKDDKKRKLKTNWSKIWYFIWEDDSIWSWIINIVIAFLLIKFVIYPGIGLILGTNYPVVAVVSGSMEHRIVNGRICGQYPDSYIENFDNFWETCGDFYNAYGINKEKFEKFSFKNGFNTGDIIVLLGKKPEDIKIGDVIVFIGARENPKPDPIIHRVIEKNQVNESFIFHTKGDHNPSSLDYCEISSAGRYECIYESDIHESQLIGKAIFRIPYLGYIKIGFVELLSRMGLGKIITRLF